MNAYHEAGHVTIGFYHGIYIHEATIDRARCKGGGGFTSRALDWTDVAYATHTRPKKFGWVERGETRRRIDYLLAGHWAERIAWRVTKRRWPKGRPTFWGLTDYSTARFHAWLLRVPYKKRREFIRRRQAPLKELVVRLWPAVEAIAQALLRKRTLRRKELCAITLRVARRCGI